MVRGYHVDTSRLAGNVVSYEPSLWFEGEPKFKERELFGFTGRSYQIKDERRYAIRSMRCDKCGFLESYAI